TYGVTVIYRCNEGYTLLGNEDSVCLADGSWSNGVPSCESVSCSKPKEIAYGNFTLNGLIYKSTASYKCEMGYRLQGPTTLMCEASGNWSSEPPSCELVTCGSPPVVRDAISKGSHFTFGKTVTYSCKE
ncbi:unnamed protein product, partial [Ranitomeya imitator]